MGSWFRCSTPARGCGMPGTWGAHTEHFIFSNHQPQLCPFLPLTPDPGQLLGQIPNSGVTCSIKKKKIQHSLEPQSLFQCDARLFPSPGLTSTGHRQLKWGCRGGHGLAFLFSPPSLGPVLPWCTGAGKKRVERDLSLT